MAGSCVQNPQGKTPQRCKRSAELHDYSAQDDVYPKHGLVRFRKGILPLENQWEMVLRLDLRSLKICRRGLGGNTAERSAAGGAVDSRALPAGLQVPGREAGSEGREEPQAGVEAVHP